MPRGLRIFLLLALAPIAACRCAPEGPRGSGAIEAQAARASAALAALFAAASEVAEPADLEIFRTYGIAPAVVPDLDALHPERRALVEAVSGWPEERKRASLEWLRPNTTWATMLHALVLESFGPNLEPRAWGPTMSAYAPAIFDERASLAPLLRSAMKDPAIGRIAEGLAGSRAAFTPAGVEEARERLLTYLAFDEELPEFHAFYNPLMSPGSGVNVQVRDGSVLMLVGPSADPETRTMVLFHEMAHQPVDRIMRRPAVAAALAESACAFEAVEQNYGYTEWRYFFGEALVRSLSYRLVDREPLDTGFYFEAYLSDELSRWESDGETSFEALVLSVLEGIRESSCGETAIAPCPPPSLPLEGGTAKERLP